VSETTVQNIREIIRSVNAQPGNFQDYLAVTPNR
jgi:hypothetical protein